MNKETFAKWVVAAILLFAPMFFCIDLACQDFAAGDGLEKSNSLLKLFNTSGMDNFPSDMKAVLAQKYWLTQTVPFAMWFIALTGPAPSPFRRSENPLYSTVIFLVCGFSSYMMSILLISAGIPFTASIIRARQPGTSLANIMDVLDAAAIYTRLTLIAAMKVLPETYASDLLSNLFWFLAPVFVIPGCSAVMGAALGSIIGDLRFKDWKTYWSLKKSIERKRKGLEPFIYVPTPANWHVSQTRKQKTKMPKAASNRETVNIQKLTGREFAEMLHEREEREEEEREAEMQVFKRKMKEKDSRWYIA